jgi:hypothetical protein
VITGLTGPPVPVCLLPRQAEAGIVSSSFQGRREERPGLGLKNDQLMTAIGESAGCHRNEKLAPIRLGASTSPDSI